jgi:hypothetical protein
MFSLLAKRARQPAGCRAELYVTRFKSLPTGRQAAGCTNERAGHLTGFFIGIFVRTEHY